MLVAKENDPVETGGMSKGKTFSIFANAKVFEILSSRIYQNEILAVIREVTCNAADAHKITGRPISDIEIHLPTFTQPHFSVRDYGPGLSPDAVENLYTTYFMSDKDNSNDMIGGFGLGSKSPFAVSDQFTVTSWHGGERHDYLMYKEDGCPAVSHIGSAPSTDPTGLEVRVAATSYPRWSEEAARFFSWWPEQPRFSHALSLTNNFDAANIFMQSDTKTGPYPDWAFFNKQYGSSKLLVFMGLVCYNVDLTAIPNVPANVTKLMTLGRGSIAFTFDIGSLAVNPSRETLSYDPSTCAALLKRFEEIQTVITTQMQAKLDAQPTLLAARQFVWGPNGYASFVNNYRQTFSWNGQPVLAEVRLAATDFSAPPTIVELGYRSYHKHKWIKRGSLDGQLYHAFNRYSNYHSNRSQRVWVPGPVTAKTYRTVQYYFDQQLAVAGNDLHHNLSEVIIIGGLTYAEVNKVCTDKGMPALLDGSTFPDPPAAPTAPRKTSTTTLGYIWKVGLDWNRQDTAIDLTQPKPYVSFFDGNPQTSLDLVYAAKQLNALAPDAEFVGFKKAWLSGPLNQKRLAKHGWVAFDPKTWWQANVSEAHIKAGAKQKALANFFVQNYSDIAKAILRWKIEKKPYVYTPNIETSLDEDRIVWSVNGNHGVFIDNQLLDNNSTSQAAAYKAGLAEATDFIAEFTKFIEANPMLQHVDWRAGKLDFNTYLAYITR